MTSKTTPAQLEHVGFRRIKSSVYERYCTHFSFRLALNFVVLILVWLVAFPTVFRKLYAEDGALYMAQTFQYKFFGEFLQPAGGYSTLVMRIGARFMRLAPLDYAPLMAATFSALCLAFLAAAVFDYSGSMVKKTGFRILLSFTLMILPLASYAAVGNICNLYFFVMAAGAILIYAEPIEKERSLIKATILMVAALSVPVCVLLLPLLIDRIRRDYMSTRRVIIRNTDWIWIVSMLLQFLFIVLVSLGQRTPHSPQSALKVFYLFLDRAIGSSIVPGWGFISGSMSAPGFENTIYPHSLAFRAAVSFAVLIGLLMLMWKIKGANSASANYKIRFVFVYLIGYSFLIGLFFNPEPRYMVFPSFCLIWVTLSALSVTTSRNLHRLVYVTGFLLMILACRPSAQLSVGPNWQDSLAKSRLACASKSDSEIIRIETLPVEGAWHVSLPCGIVR